MSNKSHPVDTKKDLNYVKKYLNKTKKNEILY